MDMDKIENLELQSVTTAIIASLLDTVPDFGTVLKTNILKILPHVSEENQYQNYSEDDIRQTENHLRKILSVLHSNGFVA